MGRANDNGQRTESRGEDMNQTQVGRILTQEEPRDAIHIALAPVIAHERLEPGTHVGIVVPANLEVADKPKRRVVWAGKETEPSTMPRVGKTGTVDCDKLIGIIDPILRVAVEKEQICWLWLYPQTITSLRHNWSHPAFPSQTRDLEMALKAESEKWLREYAARVKSYEQPEEAFQNLIHGLRHQEIFYHGSDLHSFGELKQPDELKLHAERYLGTTINYSDFDFSCSC